jgi:putative membrane protein
MINYNPKEWFTFIFRFSKADTFRKLLPLMIGVAIYSALIAYLELNYIKLADSSYIRNIGMMHNVLGFVISLLLVFRTNTAYERWWEGRRIWGSLTNSSRNLAIKVNAIIKDVEDKVFFKNMIPAYAFALKDFLQEKVENHELVNNIKIDFEKHVPNQIASAMYERFNNINHNIDLSTGQFLAINEELKAFTDICGGCERIKNTPKPFTYSVFIKKFIFF